MAAANFKAAVCEPYAILGVSLLPLSLGRYRLLRQFDCAFVAEAETEATPHDLFLGVLICSLPCREFLDLLENLRAWRRELRHWGKRIRKEIKADPHFSLLEKYGLFKHFLEESAPVPDYWIERESQSASSSHWSHTIEVCLRGELGYTAEEIEEGPMRKALMDYFKLAESQGIIRMMVDGETDQAKANEEAIEKAFAALAETEAQKEKGPEPTFFPLPPGLTGPGLPGWNGGNAPWV